jgi:hypothetical protein
VQLDEPAVEGLCRQFQEPNPQLLILRLCRELVAIQPTNSGPTPLDVLGSVRGIRQVNRLPIASGSGCSGCLVPVNGGYEVTLDSLEPPGRQRRSHAHEIVHTFFREVHPGPAGPLEESLCEVGAAELTMPTDRFRRFAADLGPLSFDQINECRDEFHVTFDAAARRAVDLSQEPACYLVGVRMRTKNQERHGIGAPQLRVASWTYSRSWPEQVGYRGVAFEPACMIAEAFESLEPRSGIAELGTNYHNGIYLIEAIGYSFPRGGDVEHRQVAALLHALPNAIA